MTVYVESNFVLELALRQEESDSCSELIKLAGNEMIDLAVPAYSLAEPYETLSRRANVRHEMARSLKIELRQLARSEPYEKQAGALEDLTVFLIETRQDERSRLQDTLDWLLRTAEVLPLTAEVFEEAFRQQERGLSPPDSIVYASVLAHLSASQDDAHVFLNRNSKDFDDPDIIAELKDLGCDIMFSFRDGINHIRSRIG